MPQAEFISCHPIQRKVLNKPLLTRAKCSICIDAISCSFRFGHCETETRSWSGQNSGLLKADTQLQHGVWKMMFAANDGSGKTSKNIAVISFLHNMQNPTEYWQVVKGRRSPSPAYSSKQRRVSPISPEVESFILLLYFACTEARNFRPQKNAIFPPENLSSCQNNNCPALVLRKTASKFHI